MKVFEHPNMANFECPICRLNDDKPVVLVGIAMTQQGRNIEAMQVHLECLELIIYSEHRIIAQNY
jgi:hypothetical protein